MSAAAKPVGADTGLTAIRDDLIAGVARYDGTPTIADQDVLVDYGAFCDRWWTPSGLRPLRP